MSFIVFDFECEKCRLIEERMVDKSLINEQYCSQCSTLMARLMPNMEFKGRISQYEVFKARGRKGTTRNVFKKITDD